MADQSYDRLPGRPNRIYSSEPEKLSRAFSRGAIVPVYIHHDDKSDAGIIKPDATWYKMGVMIHVWSYLFFITPCLLNTMHAVRYYWWWSITVAAAFMTALIEPLLFAFEVSWI